MDLEYRLIKESEHAYDNVAHAIAAVIEAYRTTNGQAWALHHPTPDADWLAQALLDFWYEDDQDGRSTRIYVGLIAAQPELMAAVITANAAKDEFFDTMAEMKARLPSRISVMKYELAQRQTRYAYLNEHLRRSGLVRLHLKQTWRHLPTLEQAASRVRLAWYTSGRSIVRTTVQECEEKLCSFNTEAAHIQQQLSALASIPSGEPLAIVQDHTPSMRANIFYAAPLPDGRLRRAMNLPLPLFIPSSTGDLPSHNQPPPQPRKERVRSVRNDVKLEAEPFLPSIRVFRYKDGGTFMSEPEDLSTDD